MVSRELFVQAVQKIRNAYDRPDFLSNPEYLSDWYEMFKDCNEWSFKQAINQTRTECKYLPVLAEIHTRYTEWENKRRHDRANFISAWHTFCNFYADEGYMYQEDKDCQKKIMELTTDKVGGDYEKGMEMLWKYQKEMRKFVDTTKEEDLPNFKEYLMKLE